MAIIMIHATSLCGRCGRYVGVLICLAFIEMYSPCLMPTISIIYVCPHSMAGHSMATGIWHMRMRARAPSWPAAYAARAYASTRVDDASIVARCIYSVSTRREIDREEDSLKIEPKKEALFLRVAQYSGDIVHCAMVSSS